MKYSALLITSIIISFSLHAQEKTSVSVVDESINKISGQALKTRINRAEEKTIAKEWKSLMKDYDGDVDIKKNKVIAEEVQIESMGSDPLTVLAEIKEVKKSEHDFIVLFYKNGQVVTSDNDLPAFTAAKTIVSMFSNKLSKEATSDYKKAQVKLFDDYEDDMKDLEKEQEKAEDAIEDAKKEIKDAQKLIEEKTEKLKENRQQQAEMKNKLKEQEKMVKQANDETKLFD